MSRSATTPKRQSVGCSLPPAMAERLHAEARARLLNPSVLIESGLSLLFTSFDRPALDEEKDDLPPGPQH